MALRFSAKAVKCTVVLTPETLVGARLPDAARTDLLIDVAGRVLRANIATKTVRRAVGTVTETGAENVALILQGKLVGDVVEEAGLTAMPKVVKAAA